MADYDIRSIFEEMELELIRSMKRNLSRHMQWEKDEEMNWTMWQAEQLKTLEQFKRENEKIFGKKFSIINKEIEEFLKDTYEISGLEQERKILNALTKGKIPNDKLTKGLEGSFFQLNEDKMNALIKATTNDLPKAEHAMLRMVNDQYRKTIFKAEVMANSGAFTLQQSIDMATKDFLKAGINCIEYKNGRRVNIASYAEMCIRTATKRVALVSEGDVRKAYGIHTVRISKYGGCSETCLPWQGKVYVDDVYSGGTKEEAKEKNVPLLSEAIAGGLFHPNCKHRATTYFYDLKKEQGKLKDDGIENPVEEQEHKKNHLHIQQQKRLEQGSLDQQNITQAKTQKEEWTEKNKFSVIDDEFWELYRNAKNKKKQQVLITPKKLLPETFKPANTIEEAIKFGNLYSKHDDFEIDDSFKLNIVNGFNEASYNVKKKFGKDLDIKGIERFPEGRRDQAAYSSTSKFVSLKNSNLSTLKNNALKNYESNWNATDDIYGVFYHEIGHAVWDDLSGSAKFEIMSLYKQTKTTCYEEWLSMGGAKSMMNQEDLFGLQLSRYASRNEKEFFSEAFSQIMSGKKSEISDKIDDILMRKYADKSNISLNKPQQELQHDNGLIEKLRKKIKSAAIDVDVKSFNELPDEFKETFNQDYKNSDVYVKQILRKNIKKLDYSLEGVFQYSPSKDLVRINANDFDSSAFVHEIFHALDNKYEISLNSNFRKELEKDYEELLKKSNGNVISYLYRNYKEAFEIIEGRLKCKDKYRGISDLFSGLTNGKFSIGYGHTEMYWNGDKMNLDKEAWAQYGRIGFTNDSEVMEMLVNEFPHFNKAALIELKKLAIKE